MKRGQSGINCLIAINKPVGMSSHDVVNRVRRILGERRVGHAGTLDPDASGVLVVGIGQATRLMGMLTLDDKRYDARICFGTETTTDDEEGEVTRTAEVPERLGEEAVAAAVVASLVGVSEQVPPAYSAISIDGKRAYQRARSGEEVELEPRTIEVHEAELIEVESGDPLVWRCALHVSKGTYIRSIARDLGRSLGCAAHLCGLVRTASGPIGIDRCLTLEELEQGGVACLATHAIDPVWALGHARHDLTEREADAVAVGRAFSCRVVVDASGLRRAPVEGERVSLVREGRLLGVWELRAGRLACVANFPGGVSGATRGAS